MKKFIFKSFLLSSLLFLLLYAADFSLSTFLKTTNGPGGEYQVWNDIYDGNIDAKLAVYGSSRAFVQFDSEILQDSLGIKTYNFGLNGHSFWLQYLRHLEYIKYNRDPEIIVLSVDVFSLAKRKDLFAYEQFLPYMLWNNEMRFYTKSFIGFEMLDFYIPLYRYKGEYGFVKKAFERKRRAPYRTLGYKGHKKFWDQKLEEKRKGNKNFTSNLDSVTTRLFHRFIEECQKNNIDVLLVYAPEHITGQEFVKNRREIIALYDKASRKYDIPFLDYSKDSLNFSKEYFYNASHLNKTGAELFTKKLASDLLEPLSSPK